MPKIQLTIPSLGNIEIYTDPRKIAKVNKLISETPKILTEAYLRASYLYGPKLVQAAKRCLRIGMPPHGSGVSWPPHSAKTIKRLGEHTLLNWTGQYMRNIKLVRRGRQVAVGLPPGKIKIRGDGERGRLTLTQVAKVLEYGSEARSIPARPLWEYLWDSVGGNEPYKKVLVREIRKEIRKHM